MENLYVFKRNKLLLLFFVANIIFVEILLLSLIIFFKIDIKIIIVLTVLTNVIQFFIAYLIFYNSKKSARIYTINVKNQIIRIMQVHSALIKTIPEFLNNLTKSAELISGGDKYSDAEKIDNMVNYLMNYDNVVENILESLSDKDLDMDKVNKIAENIELINENIMSASIETKVEIEKYNNKVFSISSLNSNMIASTTKLLFIFENSIKILSQMSKDSNDYTLETVKNVFDEFENIAVFSKQIATDSDNTIKTFLSEDNQNGLFYISSQTKNIIDKFDTYSSILTSLEELSNTFIGNSTKSLEEINNTMENIQSISEKIKLISINVRIEAARLHNENSGFKVLGNEINDFATLTSKSIKDADVKIKETIKNINNLKKQYEIKMKDMIDYFSRIKSLILPFNDIINNSFTKITSVVNELYVFSNKITKRLDDIINKFQYQDISSQESFHIIEYIKFISDNFIKSTEDLQIESKVNEEDKKQIRVNILNNFNRIITTDKERKILEYFEKEFGVRMDHKYTEEEISRFKKIDENSVLF